MRADGRADEVVGAFGVGDPIPDCLVDRRAQRPVARGHGDDFRAESTHAVDVGRLPLGVDLAHVDDAGQSEPGAGRGSGDTVLAGAGLRDDAFRAEGLREQGLADAVVDLVRARVREVLALEPHLGIPALAEPGRRGQRRRPSHPALELRFEPLPEVGGGQHVADALAEPVDSRHERFGYVLAAERPEASALVGQVAGDQGIQQGFVFACVLMHDGPPVPAHGQ